MVLAGIVVFQLLNEGERESPGPCSLHSACRRLLGWLPPSKRATRPFSVARGSREAMRNRSPVARQRISRTPMAGSRSP